MQQRLLSSFWRSRSAKHSSPDNRGTASITASNTPAAQKDIARSQRPRGNESDSTSTEEDRSSPKELRARVRAKDLEPKELERRQHEEKEFIRQNDSQETSIWFLVDVNWLQEWKEFVKRGAVLPGPIDNKHLLGPDGRPRPGLKAVHDYRGVNSTVWEFWHRRYGGGPVVKRRQLDLYAEPVDDVRPLPQVVLPENGLEDTVIVRREPEDMEQTVAMPRNSANHATVSDSVDERSCDRPRKRERSPKSTSERLSLANEGPAAREATTTAKPAIISLSAVTGVSSRGKSVPAARPRREPVEKRKLCCDKCDGPHETDECPHFKKPREKHKDAWIMLGKGGALGSQSDSQPVPIVRNARVVRQPGDGSCLFHSLSYGLGGGCSGTALRRDIVDFISRNPDIDVGPNTLKEWIQYESGGSVSSYARTMSGGSWGGAIEMAALSKMKGVSVHVYEKCSEGYRRISAFEDPRASRVINVLYQGRMHYDALII